MRVSLLIMAALFSCAAAAQDAATVVPANVIPQPGQVVASGAVPDEATKADVLARLQQVYGVGNVIDQDRGRRRRWRRPTGPNTWAS